MTSPAARARFEFLVEIYLGAVTGWVDITAYVRGQIAITRGQSSEGTRANPGTCAFQVDNTSGDFSCRNPAGQWYGLIGPNAPLRVSAGLAGGTLYERFYGEVAQLPMRWSLDGVDRYVEVTAAGILRRLGQGEQPSYSPLRRTIAGAGPLAYWPLEDGTDAGQGGSAITGVPALSIAGTAPFDDIESWTDRQFTVDYGTAALVDVSQGAVLEASLPSDVTTATATGWSIHAACDFPDSADLLADFTLLEVDTPGGTYVRWRMVLVQSTYDVQIVAYNSAGTATVVCTDTSPFIGMFTHHMVVWQNGGNINVGYVWDSVTSWQASGSVAGTLAGVTAVRVNPTAMTATDPLPVGHLALWAGQELDTLDFHDGPVMSALFTHVWTNLDNGAAAVTGEAADERLVRVWAEEGVTVSVPTAEDDPVMMGRQPTATLSDLSDQCTTADGGYLFEARDSLDLVYRTRASLYNQTSVEIAYSGQLAAPFDPVDDADQVRNDVTAKRTDGSSARYVEASGRLAAVAPPDGVGVYRTEVELNLVDDTGLLNQARWRAHLGTVDRPRYPALSVQLAAPAWLSDPSGLADLLGVDTGDVLEVTGLPSWAAGDARTLVTGYSEVFDEWTWQVTFNGVPAQPWDVAEVDGEARVAADGSTLAADLTATGITPTAWDFTTGLDGWVASGGSAAYDAAAEAGVFTPNGVSGSLEARSPNTPVTAGQTVAFIADVEIPDDANLSPYLLWRDAALSLLSTTNVTVAMLAGQRRRIAVVGTAPASTAYVMCMVGLGGTPPASRTITVYSGALSVPQSLSLASTAVNGSWTEDPLDMPLDVRVGGEQVRASRIAPVVRDMFARDVASGWGNTQTGQAWVASGGAAGDYSVTSTPAGKGLQSNGTVNVLRTALVDVGVRSTIIGADTAVPVIPAGGAISTWFVARAENLNNYFGARLDFATSGAVSLIVFKRVGGTLTTIAGPVAVGTHTAGANWRVVLAVTGLGTTTLQAKAWKITDAEPALFQITATDTGALASGIGTQVGFLSRLESGNTNTLPVVIQFDNLITLSPQLMTVSARGVNGVTRAWPAGTEVDVWQPAVIAL